MFRRPRTAHLLSLLAPLAPLFGGCAAASTECPKSPETSSVATSDPSVAGRPRAETKAGPTLDDSRTDDTLASLSDEQLARKLMDVTGAGKIGKQVADAMMAKFQDSRSLPAGFVERFKANLHPEELVDKVLPIYLKNYDRETMMAAIRFYQSRPGRKLVESLPVVTTEAMAAGQKWGEELALKTLDELGIKVPPKR